MPTRMPVDHRPWPLPTRPWVLRMQWDDLLFAHWRVEVASLREKIPPELEIDTFDGEAWLGVVPFWMRGTRPRGFPPLPGISTFPELNVRTYVIAEGKPGVWFFSLDAASRVAVRAARKTFHLPYFDAAMKATRDAAGHVRYVSRRTHRGAPEARFHATYAPAGDPYTARPGTLEHWLTERYALYARSPRGVLYRGDIHHEPWPLQPATADLPENTMARAAGIDLPDEAALLHYARHLDVIAWWPVRVGDP